MVYSLSCISLICNALSLLLAMPKWTRTGGEILGHLPCRVFLLYGNPLAVVLVIFVSAFQETSSLLARGELLFGKVGGTRAGAVPVCYKLVTGSVCMQR